MIWTLALLLTAFADVAPPSGTKNARFEINVQAAPFEEDHVLVVYPWSLSNGVPTAEVGVVLPSFGLPFGRRIEGEPAFWLVPRDKIHQLLRMKDPELRGWFAGEAAMRCGGDTPRPVHQVSVTAPDVLVERFSFELEPGGTCTVHRLSSPETGGPAAPIGGGCGCATVGALGWAGSLSLLVALGIRRRRWTPAEARP